MDQSVKFGHKHTQFASIYHEKPITKSQMFFFYAVVVGRFGMLRKRF